MIVFPFCSENLKILLGGSAQGKYIYGYLKTLGAKTCVLEKEYIDKDFTVDYQKFYCRSFKDGGKFTKRIHFFTEFFNTDKFKYALINNDVCFLSESYLGFVVIRPIEDQDGQPFIGRTILKTYPASESKKRCFITGEYTSSLFGIPLVIKSLPFQAQDQGVSACATIALWAAIHPLRSLFGIPGHSPAEITEMSTSLPAPFRKFPSDGLTMEQMVNYIKLIDLDVEYIDAINDDVIQTAVKAYIRAGLPIIANLNLKHETLPGRHAVVISGHKEDKMGNVVELYVHDDGIGPYSRVLPNGDFKHWKNEWNDHGYEVELEKLLVPIYPKVRLPFCRMYVEYSRIKADLGSHISDFDLELYLTSVGEYKRFLIGNSIKDKTEILTKSLPRFLWIVRFIHKNQHIGDQIYDGTSVYVTKLISVEFCNNSLVNTH